MQFRYIYTKMLMSYDEKVKFAVCQRTKQEELLCVVFIEVWRGGWSIGLGHGFNHHSNN